MTLLDCGPESRLQDREWIRRLGTNDFVTFLSRNRPHTLRRSAGCVARLLAFLWWRVAFPGGPFFCLSGGLWTTCTLLFGSIPMVSPHPSESPQCRNIAVKAPIENSGYAMFFPAEFVSNDSALLAIA